MEQRNPNSSTTDRMTASHRDNSLYSPSLQSRLTKLDKENVNFCHRATPEQRSIPKSTQTTTKQTLAAPPGAVHTPMETSKVLRQQLAPKSAPPSAPSSLKGPTSGTKARLMDGGPVRLTLTPPRMMDSGAVRVPHQPNSPLRTPWTSPKHRMKHHRLRHQDVQMSHQNATQQYVQGKHKREWAPTPLPARHTPGSVDTHMTSISRGSVMATPPHRRMNCMDPVAFTLWRGGDNDEIREDLEWLQEQDCCLPSTETPHKARQGDGSPVPKVSSNLRDVYGDHYGEISRPVARRRLN